MGRTKILGVAAALAISSSVAFALTVSQAHWMGAVTGKDDNKLAGTAMMAATADGKGTEVTVEFKGDTPAAVRPWHVHIGSCAKGGGVLGGGRAYTPITVDEKGSGSSKATLPITLPDTGSYYVNFHESSANMGKSVACGDLSLMK